MRSYWQFYITISICIYIISLYQSTAHNRRLPSISCHFCHVFSSHSASLFSLVGLDWLFLFLSSFTHLSLGFLQSSISVLWFSFQFWCKCSVNFLIPSHIYLMASLWVFCISYFPVYLFLSICCPLSYIYWSLILFLF